MRETRRHTRAAPAYAPLAVGHNIGNLTKLIQIQTFRGSASRVADNCVQSPQKLYAERTDVRRCRFSGVALILQKLHAVLAEVGPQNLLESLAF